VGACKQCWKGKYQDEANQVECKTCPDTQTTLGDGADNQDDCIGIEVNHKFFFPAILACLFGKYQRNEFYGEETLMSLILNL
jgi:hypothetical protein